MFMVALSGEFKMTTTPSTPISLLEALEQDNKTQFHYMLVTEGLPRGTNWLDNDLLTKALKNESRGIITYLLEKRCRVIKNDDTIRLDKVIEKVGWDSIVEKLLTLESKITDEKDKGDTVLHLAFVDSLPEYIIDLLLRHYMYETTANVKNRDGLSFLHIACTRSNEYLAKEFLETNKTDVHCQVSLMSNSIYSGYTPLHFAVEHGRLEVTKCLLQYGADIYIEDFHRSTPLHLALERRDKKIIDILCYHDNRNENCINNFGLSHFMVACASNDTLIAEQYLYVAEQNPITSAKCLISGHVKDVNEYTFAGYTPLHFAAEFGQLDTVKLLLSQGAHCCAVTRQNLTPCDLACSKEYMDICSMLLQHSCGCKSEVSQEKPIHEAPVRQNNMTENNTSKQDVDSQLSSDLWYLDMLLIVLIAIVAFFIIVVTSFL